MSNDVLIDIRANVSDLTKAFEQVQNQLKKTGEGVNGLQSTFGKLAKIAGIALIGKGIKDLATDVFNTGKTFENEMGKVQAITQGSAKDMDILTGFAKKMGKDTLASASTASQGMQFLGMAGWKTNEIMAGLPNILNLSIGASEDLALTSDIVSDALTAFGMSAQQSGSLCDIMASASSNANTNVAMLGESYKYCAPVVGALGMSAQDATIALSLMANCGIKASMGGTALRSTLTNLVKPTKKMSAELSKVGFSITDNTGKTKSLKVVMDELRQKTGQMTEAEKAKFASTIAGKEAMSGLLAVLNASPADYEKVTKAIYESDGACQKMADTMGSTLEGKLKGTSSKLEALKITLFESVKEPLKSCTDSLNNFLEWLNAKLPSAINTAVGAINLLKGGWDNICTAVKAVNQFFSEHQVLAGTLATAIGFITAELIAMTLWFNSAKIAQGAWGVVMGGFNVVMGVCNGLMATFETLMLFIASPIGIAIAVITALVAVGVLLYKNWDKVCECAKWVWAGCVEAWNSLCADTTRVFTELGTAISTIFEGIGSWISNKIEWICNTTIAGWTAFSEGVSAVWETIKAVCQVAVMLIVEIIKLIVDVALMPVMFVWVNFGEQITKVWEAIKTATSNFVTYIIAVITKWGEELWASIEPPLTKVKTFFSLVWLGIKTFLIDTWLAIKGEAVKLWGDLCIFWTKFWEDIKVLFTMVWSRINEALVKCWTSIKVTAIKLWISLKEFWNTYWTAIKDFFSTVWNSIKAVLTSVWNSIKATATSVFEGIKQVIQTVWNAILAVTTPIWNSISSVISSVWNTISSLINSAISGVKSTVSSGFNAVKSTATSIWNSIKSAIISPIQSAFDRVSSIISRIKGLFNFSWSLPHLKLPHFEASGQFSLNPLSVPHFGISWHKDGGIFTRPTVLGAHGFGEAGKEAILPLGKLPQLIGIDKQQALLDKVLQEGSAGGQQTINIENFVNNREQDVEQLAKELEFYKRRIAISRGGY